MASIGIPGLQGKDAVRFSSGQGSFAERTIELGGTVICIRNIGSIRVYHGERNHVLAILGALMLLGGLFQASQPDSSGALLIAGIGAILIVANFLIKAPLTLSIGTCDGRYTNIESTDKDFLAQLLTALKRKIDSDSVELVGGFDVSTKRVEIDGI